MAPESIGAIFARGQAVRAWCWRCARAGGPWEAGELPPRLLSLPLAAAALRMPCRECQAADCVSILPARAAPMGDGYGAIWEALKLLGRGRRRT